MKGIFDGNTLLATFQSDPLEALRPKVNLRGLSADEDFIYLGDEPIFSIAPIPDQVEEMIGKFIWVLKAAYVDLVFAVQNPLTYNEGRLKAHAEGIQAIAKFLGEGKAKETLSLIALSFRLFSEREFLKTMSEAQIREFLSALEKVITSLEEANGKREA